MSEPLPKGVFAVRNKDGEIISYKVRWREPDGTQPSKSFSVTAYVDALAEAESFLYQRSLLIRRGHRPERPGEAEGASLTLAQLGVEWVRRYAASNLEQKTMNVYGPLWDRQVLPRIGHYTLAELVAEPAIFVEFQEALNDDGVGPQSQRKILSLVQSVLKRGRRWYPHALPTNPAEGMFELPSAERKTKVRPLAPVVVERIREAILQRPTQDPLVALREATFISVLGYTVACRPQELYALTWGAVFEHTAVVDYKVSLGEIKEGTKTGEGRPVRFYRQARQDLEVLRAAVTARTGAAPAADELIFPMPDGRPMTEESYKNFTRRQWREACTLAAERTNTKWVAKARVYDLRHSAISYALRQKLDTVQVAALAGNNAQVTSKRYAHVIVEAQGAAPWEPELAIDAARDAVAADPSRPPVRNKGGRPKAKAKPKATRRAQDDPGSLAA